MTIKSNRIKKKSMYISIPKIAGMEIIKNQMIKRLNDFACWIDNE
jgi:hypothetical protein